MPQVSVPPKKPGISHWLVFNIAVISTVIIIVATALQIAFQYTDSKRDLQAASQRVWHSYEQAIAASLYTFDEWQLKLLINGISATSVTHVEIINTSGKVVFESGKRTYDDQITQTFPIIIETQRAHIGPRELTQKTSLLRSNSSDFVKGDIDSAKTAQIGSGGVRENLGTIVLQSSLTPLYATLWKSGFAMLVLNALRAGVLAVAFFILLNRYLTLPIKALAAEATRISSGDYAKSIAFKSKKIPARFQNEIVILTENMEKMREQMNISLSNANKEISKQQELISPTFETMSDPLILLSADGNFEYVNPAAEHQLFARKNYSISQWTQHNLLKAILNNSVFEVTNLLPNKTLLRSCFALDSTTNNYVELELKGTKPGETLSFLLTATHIDSSEGALLVFHNITERKLLEREMQNAKDRAEAADRAKSDFLAFMSHEVRSPLAGISMALELIKKRNDISSSRKLIESISASSNQIINMLNSTLSMARIDAGFIDVEISSFSPEKMIREIAELFTPQSLSQNTKIDVVVSNNLPSQVTGDQNHIHQILNNLVSNASKFTQNGIITITAEWRGESSSLAGNIRSKFEENGVLKVSVCDTGCGISAANIQEIFEPYRQIGKFHQRARGTGLGLAIAKSLAERMSGSITVKSQEGRGSEFTLTIPLLTSQMEFTENNFDKIQKNENLI